SSLRSRLSHELRTPLNSIITLSQLLMENEAGPISAEQRRYMEVIRRNGRNLLALVDQLGGSPAAGPGPATTQPSIAGAPEPPPPPDPADEVEAAAAQPQTDPPHAPGPVLLIEDDPIERQRIGSFIESAGYEVTRAASGEEGLALLRSRPFAAVVLGLIMPGMTGPDVLRAARTQERLGGGPLIVPSPEYNTTNAPQGPGPQGAHGV